MRVRYTVLSVSRGPDEPAPPGDRRQATGDSRMSTWVVTLADKDGKRHLLSLVQPSDRPIPHTTGAVLDLDPRLLSAEGASG